MPDYLIIHVTKRRLPGEIGQMKRFGVIRNIGKWGNEIGKKITFLLVGAINVIAKLMIHHGFCIKEKIAAVLHWEKVVSGLS
jgi:hypothetical protein